MQIQFFIDKFLKEFFLENKLLEQKRRMIIMFYNVGRKNK